MADVTEVAPASASSGTPERAKTGYRPDIDGLRAIAVTTVVIFHAFPQWLPGGFVGVDVFFVISGFLITGLLAAEVAKTGTVSIAGFYARRIRRLLPLSALVLLFVVVATWVWLPPLDVPMIMGNVIAAALYVSNIAFASQATDYMAAQVETSPVLHYWSLSVEEQFYVVWPLLMIVLAVVARRRAWGHERMRSRLLIALGVVGVASLALSVYLTAVSPNWAFFGLPTRAWELAAGGALALAAPALRSMTALASRLAGYTGLALIVISCFALSSRTPYPGVAALLPVLGTVLVLAAGVRTSAAGPSRALAVRPMVAIGLLSYSWYLWHWPVLVFARALFPGEVSPFDTEPVGTSWQIIAIAVVVSLALAWVSHVLIEDPVRHSARLRSAVGLTLIVGAVLTLVPVGAALAVRAVSVRDSQVVIPVSVPGQTSVVMQMTPAQAAADLPQIRDCQAGIPGTELGADCLFGDPKGTRTMVLIGDSHASSWFPAFDAEAKKNGWKLYLFAKGSCPVAQVPVVNQRLGRSYTECDTWRDAMVAKLGTLGTIDALVIGRSGNYPASMVDSNDAPLPLADVPATWAAGMASFLKRLPSQPRRVIVVRDSPWATVNIPSCLSENPGNPSACDLSAATATNIDAPLAQGEATVPQITFVDVTDQMCSSTVCPVISPTGLIKYRDSHHLTASYAEEIAAVLWKRLELS